MVTANITTIISMQDSNLLLWDVYGRLLKVFSGQAVVSLRACKFTWDARSVVSVSMVTRGERCYATGIWNPLLFTDMRRRRLISHCKKSC